MRRVALAAAVGLLVSISLTSAASADTADDTCSKLSPSASFCIGLQKLADAAAAECREIGRPASDCEVPLSHKVAGEITRHYDSSWLHTAAVFQSKLGDPLPLRRAQWLGTHNSFNSLSGGFSPSHTDSNQQLSLTQQLDIDIRSLELDLHWIKSPNTGGENAVVVCHGRGPDQANFGCTDERTLHDVLPEIAGWLNSKAHKKEVVLLYLEDELGDPAAYKETLRVLDGVLRRRDGKTMIYKPSPSQIGPKGCADLPLGLSRNRVRRRGARVVLVGNCRSGWAADVWGWDDVHVESGSTPDYRPFPKCDATYSRQTYDSKLVRYYEDSTYVSAAVDPTESPDQAHADRLTPDRTNWMARCGVNLFGFDQILPDDGRIAASIWSWAQDKPAKRDGKCAVQRSDGRWTTNKCTGKHRAACRRRSGWKLTARRLHYWDAWRACGARFDLPRTGYENSLLRQKAGNQTVWVRFRLP